MPQKGKTGRAFRVGRVKAYRRGKVWYLCHHEHGRRKRPRVGRDKAVARKLAAEVNAQLETGAPSMLGARSTAPNGRARAGGPGSRPGRSRARRSAASSCGSR